MELMSLKLMWMLKVSHFWMKKHVYTNINYILIYTDDKHRFSWENIGSTWLYMNPHHVTWFMWCHHELKLEWQGAECISDSKWLNRDQNMENEKKHDDGGMDHPELYTSFIYYLVLWSPACAMVCLILYLLSFIQRFNILYRKRFDYFTNLSSVTAWK